MAFEGIGPTHVLKAKHVTGPATATLGVGWYDASNGRMRIRLNPCVNIDWKDEVYLTLFPADEDEEYKKRKSRKKAKEPEPKPTEPKPDEPEEHIPF